MKQEKAMGRTEVNRSSKKKIGQARSSRQRLGAAPTTRSLMVPMEYALASHFYPEQTPGNGNQDFEPMIRLTAQA